MKTVLSEIFCENCKMLKYKCKCRKNPEKHEVKVEKHVSLKERVLKILEENREMLRKDFKKYGIKSDGSLSKVLKELEKEGKVRIEKVKINGRWQNKVIFVC